MQVWLLQFVSLSVMSFVDVLTETPVSSVATTLLLLFFVGSLLGGEAVVAKTSLVLTDTVGTNFYLWNLVTAGFLETNVLKLALDLAW
mmetsp:Transcript_13115/g.31016  ORF Transcript_13115/g.31016 Transcript_13115/m.31016 type:complete len:88 (+) Transcript_13115:38-301(+)